MNTPDKTAKALDEVIERLMDDGVDTDVLDHAIGLKIAKGASVNDICDEVGDMISQTAQKLADEE